MDRSIFVSASSLPEVNFGASIDLYITLYTAMLTRSFFLLTRPSLSQSAQRCSNFATNHCDVSL